MLPVQAESLVHFKGEKKIMKKTVFRVLAMASLIASVSFLTTGCAKKTVRTDEGVAASTATTSSALQQQEQRRVETIGADESLSAGARQAAETVFSEGRTSGPLLPIYFDFDRSDVRDDQKARIDGDAEYMKTNPAVTVRIEGNCDERGTNEYNMALGERRAMSAKKYLLNKGISEERLQTVSYGEEKPLVEGSDESVWSKNRRDDFVIVR